MNDEQIKEKLLMDNMMIKAMGEALEKMLAQQQRLSADASGASNIKYKGSPVVKSSTSGAANVKQIK